MYANNNDKAIKFGEAHLRQMAGRIRGLRETYDKRVSGSSWSMGGLAPRHKGMTPVERRQAIVQETEAELGTMEAEFRELTSLIEDLKETVEKHGDSEEKFFRIMCRTNRQGIARITGDDPRKYVGEFE